MERLGTELIMLGTGNAMVTRCYNTCFVLRNGGDYLLVDAGGGNGVFGQLDKVDIDVAKLKQMFVTHAHTDHVLGVVWVIRKIGALMSKGKYEGVFRIYGHHEVVEAIRVICGLTLPKKIVEYFDMRILFCEVADGDRATMAGMEFQFFDIASTKMKQFGFRGVLPDGQVLVCLGDEPYNEVCRKYVEGADWLLSEAFCLYADREVFFPYEKHHSTALDAGRLAKVLQVKNLVLYHTEDRNLAVRKVKYTQEAMSVFDGNVFVPDDLERIGL